MSEESGPVKPGDTGGYPDGKITEDDDGSLAVGIGIDPKSKNIILDFGPKPVKWIGFPKGYALQLIEILKSKIEELDKLEEVP